MQWWIEPISKRNIFYCFAAQTHTHTLTRILSSFFGNHIGCRIINKFNLTYTTKTCQNMLVSSCLLFFFSKFFLRWAVVVVIVIVFVGVGLSFILHLFFPFFRFFFIHSVIFCVLLGPERLAGWSVSRFGWCSELSVAFVCISVNLVINALWSRNICGYLYKLHIYVNRYVYYFSYY